MLTLRFEELLTNVANMTSRDDNLESANSSAAFCIFAADFHKELNQNGLTQFRIENSLKNSRG